MVVFDKRNIVLDSFEEFFYFGLESFVQYSFKKYVKRKIGIGNILFLISNRGEGMAIVQRETDGRIFWQLRVSLSPIFNQCNVAWCFPCDRTF